MTDIFFCFGDEFIYSNNLANWSIINPGKEIEIIGDEEGVLCRLRRCHQLQ